MRELRLGGECGAHELTCAGQTIKCGQSVRRLAPPRNFRHAKMPSRQPRPTSPEDPGSGVPVAAQPFTYVSPARVFAAESVLFVAPANTQPLMVPASVLTPPDAADMVKAFPARMSPSKVIGPELPTLMVASVPTIQKMLLACAPFSSVNVIAPFTVRGPEVLIMKYSLGLFWASNVKVMPVVVEMASAVLYTLSPVNK